MTSNSELSDAVERLAYLAKSETFTNPFGVEIESHPEMGAIEWQEACAEFVGQYGTALVTELRRRTPSLADGAETYEKCADCNGTGLCLDAVGEPDMCRKCTGNTVVPTPAERVSDEATEELCERLDEYGSFTDPTEHENDCAKATALIRSRAEQIAALTKERDALEAEVFAHRTTLLSNVAQMRARAEAAEAKLLVTEKALQPFAQKMAWPLSDRDSGRQVFCHLTGSGNGAGFGLEVDDFRAALAALSSEQGNG